jgi:hexulose-6-phosphate isomerase
MSRPLLQLALDHTSLVAAQRDVALLKDHVDIVEAGTILCLSEGLNAVRALRAQCPEKIIVADWKVADAGETLAQQALDAGANWMTIICAAPLATIEKGHAVAAARGGEIQIELFGNWTFDDARDWYNTGVRQAIYHRGRDAQASGQQWGEADLARMKALSDIGLELSITGGITPADLPLFKEINVKAFIAGRAVWRGESAAGRRRIPRPHPRHLGSVTMRNHPLGIYEKALPKDLSWPERLVLAKSCGFDFVEMSVDETDERLSRLEWTTAQRASLVEAMLETNVSIPSMCLSAHRRFPFGSRDETVRERARDIMTKAIKLARDLGIRTIQLAGYDVYYEEHDAGTQQRFAEGLAWAVEQAAGAQVMLAVEIMDTAFMNSITKWKKWDEMLASPWFTVYPDVGNLSAWGNDVPAELALGIDRIAAIHLKDTQPVTETSPGQFRDVPFGEGCVDFVNVFSTLQNLNYRGAFLIEMWTEKAKEPVLEIIQARRWIEARMQEGGFVC